MKTLTIYLRGFLFMIVLSATSCSDSFLDLQNPQSLPLKGTIKDLKTLTTASNGAYAQFKDVNYYNRTFILLPDLLGDNVFVSRSNGGRYLDQDAFAITREDGYVQSAWAAMYRTIVNANLSIAGGEALSANAAINQVIGEMYAVRALAYFDLVRLFAQPYNYTADASHMGVPLVVQPYNEIISPPRATVRFIHRLSVI